MIVNPFEIVVFPGVGHVREKFLERSARLPWPKRAPKNVAVLFFCGPRISGGAKFQLPHEVFLDIPNDELCHSVLLGGNDSNDSATTIPCLTACPDQSFSVATGTGIPKSVRATSSARARSAFTTSMARSRALSISS